MLLAVLMICSRTDRMECRRTDIYAIVRSCAMEAWMDNFFFSTDLINYLHMRTAVKVMGKIVKGYQQTFTV
jgi:hypothetical protein